MRKNVYLTEKIPKIRFQQNLMSVVEILILFGKRYISCFGKMFKSGEKCW